MNCACLGALQDAPIRVVAHAVRACVSIPGDGSEATIILGDTHPTRCAFCGVITYGTVTTSTPPPIAGATTSTGELA